MVILRDSPYDSAVFGLLIPIGSLYGRLTHMYHTNQLNAGKHAIDVYYGTSINVL